MSYRIRIRLSGEEGNLTKYDSWNEMKEWGRELRRLRKEEPEQFCCVCDSFADRRMYDLLIGKSDYNIAICEDCHRAVYYLGLTVNEVVECRFKRGTPFSIDALYRASMHLNTSDTKDKRS